MPYVLHHFDSPSVSWETIFQCKFFFTVHYIKIHENSPLWRGVCGAQPMYCMYKKDVRKWLFMYIISLHFPQEEAQKDVGVFL
jgi:hypothetical protein